MRVAFEALTEQSICTKKKGTFFTLNSPPSRYDFGSNIPPHPGNGQIPYSPGTNDGQIPLGVPGRMLSSVHDTSAYQEINCFSLEKAIKGESPQKTHLFIFTLTTVPFPVLSRRQQKYKSQEKITDLISRRNESNILCINASFSLIKEP